MNLLISGHRKIEAIEPVCQEIYKRLGDDNHLIVGLAMGTDIIAAEQCLKHTNWLITAGIPHYGQEAKFPLDWKRRYWKILSSERVNPIYVTEGPYDKGSLFRRNHWMVQEADRVVCFMHSEKSGTGHTYRFAREQGKRVHHYDPIKKAWVH